MEQAHQQMRERLRCEESLIEFFRAGWSSVDAAPYQDCWAVEALCDHLQAVSHGHIKRLLVNFPPRCSKTLVSSVAWPAWTWAQSEHSFLLGPSVKFLCGSYGHDLALLNSSLTRRLIGSPWYQSLWGDRFTLALDQNTKHRFDTDKGGSRIANSVTGSLLGIGGDIVLIDDPHNTQQVESEAERETVQQWWREIRSTRLNNPKESPIVVIMQRLHEEDVSGLILNGSDASEWEHLMLPMEYESGRHCHTVLHWDETETNELETFDDPRTEDGELMWPERFGHKEVESLKRDLGPYMASGRLQQSPHPPGGGILKREWWQCYGDGWYNPANLTDKRYTSFPTFQYLVGSLDTAYTEKQENDYSAFTLWGVWEDKHGNRKIMLVHAWRDRLELHELVEKVHKTCKRFLVDNLLVEDKAAGHPVAQELQRLYKNAGYGVQLINPKAQDKVARAYSVQNLLADGMIHAPDREWALMVMDECAMFPKGAHDDLVDSTTMAWRFLRNIGLAELPEERQIGIRESMRMRSKVKPLYPGMRVA